MSKVNRINLDVLKPHIPNALEFAAAIADQGSDYRVNLTVVEIDEKTESVRVIIEGDDIQFEQITAIISEMGGSVHSIDEAEVVSKTNFE